MSNPGSIQQSRSTIKKSDGQSSRSPSSLPRHLQQLGTAVMIALLAYLAHLYYSSLAVQANSNLDGLATGSLPSQAQLLDQRTFNVLGTVQPPSVLNGSTVRALVVQSAYYRSSFLRMLPLQLSQLDHSTYMMPISSRSSVRTRL